MGLSVVFVNYHSAALCARALASWRADLAGSGLEVEWTIVDNGDDAAGEALLATLPARLVRLPDNPGYAAAVVAGLAGASGEVFAVANPDLEILPGASAALLAALEAADVVGPRFVWDRAGRILLPPTERRTLRDELAALVAARSPYGAWLARRRWRRHARRHWEAVDPVASSALSGALLLFRRAAWEAVGPFEVGYRLYFEETDWLLRADRMGLRLRHVPGARVVHWYAQSSRREGQAQAWFEASARRFRQLAYGSPAAAALERLAAAPARRSRPHRVQRSVATPGRRTESAVGPFWLELAHRVEGYPAAAERLGEPLRVGDWQPPVEVIASLPEGSELSLRLVDGEGAELAAWRWRHPSPATDAGPHGASSAGTVGLAADQAPGVSG